MTNSNDWLDRFGDDFEIVKEILVAVARRAEATDERLDRLAQRQERTQVQLDQLNGSVNQLAVDAGADRSVMFTL